MNEPEIVRILRSGGVGVLATDTIYGLVGSALSRRTVERIYKLRKRNQKKPMIILISSLRELDSFGVVPDADVKKIVILRNGGAKFSLLT